MTIFQTLADKKARGEKIVALTCYDYPTAQVLNLVGIDLVLVGDSVAMVVYGDPDTKAADMPMMLRHTRAVARGFKSGVIVADMPIHSYDTVPEAIASAQSFLDQGAQAVKVEGAGPVCHVVEALVDAGIPVLAHLGLTPQTAAAYRVQGREAVAAEKLLADAESVQTAGAFALVLEMMPSALAAQVTHSIDIPTVGIGAGAEVDGQILVISDLIGLFDDFKPKFVKRYGDAKGMIRAAVGHYRSEVQSGLFPASEHGYE